MSLSIDIYIFIGIDISLYIIFFTFFQCHKRKLYLCDFKKELHDEVLVSLVTHCNYNSL